MRVNIPNELEQRIREIAGRELRSASQECVHLIKMGLKKQGRVRKAPVELPTGWKVIKCR